MKYFSSFCLYLCLLSLCACTLNTKFDDADYRPVGASTPLNSETHTLTETRTTKIEQEPDTASIRYVRPNSEFNYQSHTQVTANTKAGNSEKKKGATTLKMSSPSGNDQDSSQSREIHENIVTSTIKEVLNTRYGHSEQILKIYKTVKIHCDKQAVSSQHEIPINICQYQFPKFCGAHKFSIISNNNRHLLMFNDKNHHRNIIDTLIGDKRSAPGLWDNDDYISSELLTVKQLFNKDSMKADSFGWTVNVDKHLKTQLGRSYFTAINETTNCF